MIHARTGRVEIYDTDASGLIFYGAPTRWLATAEQELYDAVAIRWPMMASQSGEHAPMAGPSAPTRSYEVHIDAPLRFGERYDHEAWISEVGRTSFAFAHRISVAGRTRVRATVRRVYVIVAGDGTMAPAEVPPSIRAHLVDRQP